MHKKICISKRIGVTILIVVITIISLLLSSSLLKTKTSYQSKAAPPAPVIPKTIGNAIIKGKDAKDGQWPFMAVLLEKDIVPTNHYLEYPGFCTGTLIDPYWVLTAAHCLVNGIRPEHMEVFIGSVDVQKKQRGINVYDVDDYYLYQSPNKKYSIYQIDLALLKLKSKVDVSIEPVRLDFTGRYESEGLLGVISGWGGTDNHNLSQLLQYGVLPLISNQRAKYYPGFDGQYQSILPSNIVAGWLTGGTTTDGGDSGGPLLVWDGAGWVQIGITSWGITNSIMKNAPQVYTRISYNSTFTDKTAIDFETWIFGTMKSNSARSWEYGSNGFFVGEPLSKTDTEYYDSRICDRAMWNNQLPVVCKKK